jgi:protein-L-isoaspartate(D-aspartate) O-methyltransferase
MNQQAWDILVQNLIKRGVLRSPKVINALRKVPREQFLPENAKPSAALDCPLSIGWGQTVSAPLG